ncbi:uncharacterized protein LOC130992987 isoform X2 [Salvia miltiorrhiza]|uniref:uncharacterized protein LOC130992987 isoform X2 n=1 Tax=Salvia miltiorrhiza TaxID=226208 RepID=UPI0025AD4C1A|nr:uncharacterized protein LOC130992987 isoform X2 [Salvia miltiorrhiza]
MFHYFNQTGNRFRTALVPLDENSSELASNVNGGESPIYGCVRKDFPVRKLHYRSYDIDNIICCTTPLSIREKAIAMYCMHSHFLPEGKVLFMFKDIELCIFDLVSLRIGSVVQPSIINAWSIILNHIFVAGSSQKPVRFFASTDIYIDCISQPGMSYVSRRKLFFDGMDRELRLYQTNSLGSIDMFFFPVFPDDQPYVLCFDLPKEVIFIIDTSVEVNKHPVSSNYNDLCHILRSLLAEFLNNNREHLSSASVSKSVIEVLNLNCTARINSVDVGLYVMRHMETFEGDTSVNWSTGIMNATQHQLGLLRLRYCATIVSWEKNKYKDEILKESSTKYEAELSENASKFDGVFTG